MVKTTNYHFKNILYLSIFYINVYIVVYHEWFEQQRNMVSSFKWGTRWFRLSFSSVKGVSFRIF